MAEVGRFPHLADFGKDYIVFIFLVDSSPTGSIPAGLFLFHRSYMEVSGA